MGVLFDDTPEFVDFIFPLVFFLIIPWFLKIMDRFNLACNYYHILYFYEVKISCFLYCGCGNFAEYRGQGVIRLLLKEAGRILEERSNYISILLPFQYEFYRKYGWEVCYDLLIYNNIEPPVRHRKSKIISNIEKGRLRK